MVFQNCKSNLFLSTLIVTIAVTLQSGDEEKNPKLTECHWDAHSESTKAICIARCSTYSGFWDPTSNKLICYHDFEPASIIEWTTGSCECGRAFASSPNRPGLPCTPEMKYEITTSIGECETICSKIKIYKYKSHRFIRVSYCDDSNKVVPHKLQFVPNYYDKRLEHTHGYHCQCAVRSSLLSTNSTISTEESDKGDEELSPVPANVTASELNSLKMCQINEFLKCYKEQCTSVCNSAKGFIPQNSEELVCFHSFGASKVISSGNYCQCGMTPLYTSRKGIELALACVPEMIDTTISAESDECRGICSNTKAYVFGHNNFHNARQMQLTRCEPFNQNIIPSQSYDKLEPRIGKRTKVTISDGSEKLRYPCTCGVGQLLPLDYNNKKNSSIFRHLEYTGARRNDNSGPVRVPESSETKLENSLYDVARNHYDKGQVGKETRKRKESVDIFPNTNRNISSREADSSFESNGFDIPTPPPITQDLESFLEIMDNFNEPERDNVTPSIYHSGVETYEAAPLLSTLGNTNKDNNKERGSSSQVLHNHRSRPREDTLLNIRADMSYLFPRNVELPPSLEAPDFPTNRIISPMDINQPSAHCHHQNDGLESITNPYFIGSSLSQTPYNQDYRQKDPHYPNISSANAIFRNEVLSTSPNVPANNDLSDLVFQTRRITSPFDLNPPSTYCGHQSGSLESITNSYFKTGTSSRVLTDQVSPPTDNYYFSDVSSAAISAKTSSNNDLFDMVFKPYQTISPSDSDPPSTDCQHGTGSLESMTKAMGIPFSSSQSTKRIRMNK